MDAEESVRLRRVVNKLARQFNGSSTDEGLTPTQASVLGLVCGRGPVSLGELARLEHLNPTMLSRVVGALDERQLLIRTPDPDDLRSASLTATELGQTVHERIRDQRAAAVSRAAAELSDPELRALVRALPVLERLAETLAAG